MLSAIKDLGDLITNRDMTNDRLTEGKVISIAINADEPCFIGIDIEDFNQEKVNLYLFKEGSSKGHASVPFAPVTATERTYHKIKKWLKSSQKVSEAKKEDKDLLNKINIILKDNEAAIIEGLKQKVSELPKKKSERRYLTLSLKFEGNKRYLGEFDIFNKWIKESAILKCKKSFSRNQVCSVCGFHQEEVSGKLDIFKFYTIDKPGFIAGGCKEIHAWKNFPVCPECRSSLEVGRKFVDTRLKFKFCYGLSYLLIPKLLITGEDTLEEVVKILSDTAKTVSLKEMIKKRITSDENGILEYLSEVKDVMSLNFLFLRKEQSAERILLLIEDVLPSRLQKIFKAKEQVEELFKEEFNFGKLRTFFSKSDFSKSDEGKQEYDLNKYFLEIVDSVFKGKRLNFPFILKFFMAVIRREFINDGYFSFRVKDALVSLMFLEYLGLITFEEVTIMDQSIFESVFQRFNKSFSSPVNRGVFLLGTLTQLLLNKQYSEREAKPFMKKLKSLKMDEKDIRALLPEVQNKLEEYDSFGKGKRMIASEISKYLLEAGDGWKISVDEINFYFVCGMNLVEGITAIVYPQDNLIKE